MLRQLLIDMKQRADIRIDTVNPDELLYAGYDLERAGEMTGRFQQLLDQFDFHTLLRLPTGIFYKPGVKANVLFFDKRGGGGEALTEALWVDDFRTNRHFTLKNKPLRDDDLADFIASYRPEVRHRREAGACFRRFDRAELIARGKLNLDLFLAQGRRTRRCRQFAASGRHRSRNPR